MRMGPSRPYGGDAAKRAAQVTRAELRESGTMEWEEVIGGGIVLSWYAHKGGHLLYEEPGHSTAVRMEKAEADAARSTREGLFGLVQAMQARVDANVDAYRARHEVAFDPAGGSGPIGAAEAVGADPGEIVANIAVAAEALDRALSLMTDNQRSTWLKSVVEELTFQEIAAERGISRQAVRKAFLQAQRIVDGIRGELE